MGQRFRLKKDYNISSFSPKVQVILQALKTYGGILADNGTSWHLTGIGDLRWNDDEMHALTRVTGDNFEAVDESSLMLDPNSGQVRGTTPTVPTGWATVVSKNSGKCLDIKGGPAATWQTANAQQYTCLGSAQTNQQFQFTPVSGGGYKITARHSGLALQFTGGTSAINTSVVEQWPFETQSYQVWSVSPTSDGYFTISVKGTNSCMDVKGVSAANFAPVQQWTCTGGANQKWNLVPVQ
jgi:hypothetical protein